MLVSAPYAPLRRLPREDAELDDEAWYGQYAEVLEALGAWRRVRMQYGYESYARAADLIGARYAPHARLGVVRAAWADVQALPGYRAPCLLTLPRGSVLRVGEAAGDWQKVLCLDGREGFVRGGHIGQPPEKFGELTEAILRRRLSQSAQGYLGTPYRWGGRTPCGIDCSGLCHAAYLLNGVTIYRNARIEPGYPVREIPMGRVHVGDLLYFPGHIAMYLGQGRYIHATGHAGSDGVVINSLRKRDALYREDLAKALLGAGSIF
ncbi:MAG: C40 family peptidase [Christensenellaceae bacterium]|jgi:hypothetical protein|nr:C40 family peptidase [Christensenellaceae bacterium]